MLPTYINKLLQGDHLTETEAESAMEVIMTGNATPAQIGGYLIALRMKGETVGEITGSARAMRAQASRVIIPPNGPLLDTAGTGGDGAHTFNVSTTAAFIIAGAGRKVAKHGNRAASSKCGSADVLAALGVNLDLTPEQVATCIQQVGIGFLFAPKFHPAMKYAIGPRRELGTRTIFNLLGPLTNPAGAKRQLLGVYGDVLVRPLAEVLRHLGSERAWIVHGRDGLDELSVFTTSHVADLEGDRITEFDVDPARWGLAHRDRAGIAGGSAAENAARIRAVLAGESGAARDIVVLNTAAALVVGGVARDLEDGIARARQAIDSGAARRKLEELAAFSARE